MLYGREDNTGPAGRIAGCEPAMDCQAQIQGSAHTLGQPWRPADRGLEALSGRSLGTCQPERSGARPGRRACQAGRASVRKARARARHYARRPDHRVVHRRAFPALCRHHSRQAFSRAVAFPQHVSRAFGAPGRLSRQHSSRNLAGAVR